MSVDNTQANTPAAAWAWLTQRLAILEQFPEQSILREWSEFRSQNNGRHVRAQSFDGLAVRLLDRKNSERASAFHDTRLGDP